jgi:hypothetical protein
LNEKQCLSEKRSSFQHWYIDPKFLALNLKPKALLGEAKQGFQSNLNNSCA